jgi:hypothetical protein
MRMSLRASSAHRPDPFEDDDDDDDERPIGDPDDDDLEDDDDDDDEDDDEEPLQVRARTSPRLTVVR